MIENFRFINNIGESLIVKYNTKHQFITSQKETEAFLYGARIQSIAWDYEGKEVHLKDEDYRVVGVTTLDERHVIAIFHERNYDYPSPLSAKVYNVEGEMVKEVSLPKLKSKLAAKYYRQVEHPISMFFESVYRKVVDGVPKIVFSIGFMRDWYEEQVFDEKAFVFLDSIGAGQN